MRRIIRVIDGGGNGFRRADVEGYSVENLTFSGPLGSVGELLDFACASLTDRIFGLAYAMAGEIKNCNKIVKSPNIHLLDGVALGDLTKQKSGKPVSVFHDVASAAIGVSRLYPRLKSFIMLNLGSGIGLRVLHNGVLSAEGEGGHIPLMRSSSFVCGCGLSGCAESICGGESTKRRVIFETQKLKIRIPNGMHPCAFLDREFDNGQEWAKNIYDLVAVGMGNYLAVLQAIFHLPVIAWKGTFARQALPRIEKRVREVMRLGLSNPDWEKETEFMISPEPEKDSLIGAAALFEKMHK